MRRAAVLGGLVAGALLALPMSPATAQPDAVTLEVSATQVTFGESVRLSGRIEPVAAGETVEIRTDADVVVATDTTGSAGGFSVTYAPRANAVLHAVWGTAESEPVSVGVHAVVKVSLGAVRLFDRALATGTVRPLHPGGVVGVSLIRAGRVVARRDATIRANGSFSVRFPIDAPGSYRARARFDDDDHLPGADASGRRTTPLPSLREGSHGVYVRLLERRLVQLNYRLVGVDRSFDHRTADAVMAFRKVQRMTRTGTVDEAVWRALADPIVPRPLLDRRALHVEVDQSRQVLLVVEDREVIHIIHVSTGKPSTPTRNGLFRIRYKVPGYTPKRLYYASFFDGQRAIHGWPDVPPYAASHGCVRVPYWHAKWIFRMTPVGTPVKVYR
jgi:hypothetical protein